MFVIEAKLSIAAVGSAPDDRTNIIGVHTSLASYSLSIEVYGDSR